MSMDIIAYIDNFKSISKEGCEKYLLQFDLKTQVHPETKFETDTGFLPFKVEFTSIDSLKGKAFLSGFEIYSSAYDYNQELKEIREFSKPHLKKRGGIMGLFKKASIQTENMNEDIQDFINSPEIDSALKKCGYSILLSFHNMDELVLASAFASYLAEIGNGVVYDTQSGKYFYKNIRQEMYIQVNEAFNELVLDIIHPFEGWN